MSEAVSALDAGVATDASPIASAMAAVWVLFMENSNVIQVSGSATPSRAHANVIGRHGEADAITRRALPALDERGVNQTMGGALLDQLKLELEGSLTTSAAKTMRWP